MIRHIVMFRLKEFPSPEEKKKAAEKVLEKLNELPRKISIIRSFEAGINLKLVSPVSQDPHAPRAFDLVLDMTFDSSEDLEKYRVHPAHVAFIEFNRSYSVEKTVVDFNIS